MLAVLAAGSLACGDDVRRPVDGPAGDAGTDGGAPDVAAALSPRLTPCPDGLVESDAFGVPVCEPASVPDTCPAGQASFGGSTGCTPVGAACPAGDWPEAPATGEVLYVRPGGTGDGSRHAPMGSLREAMAAAGRGAVVALAKGTYTESLDVRGGVTIVGACAAETILSPGSGLFSDHAVRLGELDAALRDVTVAPPPGVRGILARGRVSLSSVVVRNAAVSAITTTTGADIDASRVLVDGVRAASAADFGRAIEANAGAVLRFDELVVTGVDENAVFAAGEGTVVEVRRGRFEGNGLLASAPRVFAVQNGGAVRVRECVVRANRGAIGTSLGPGAELTIEDSFLHGARIGDTTSRGVLVHDGGRAVLRRVSFTGVDTVAVGGIQDASVVLEDVFIAQVTDGGADVGFAIAVGGSSEGRPPSSLLARRVWVEDPAAMGLAASNASGGGSASLDVEDLTIERVGAAQPAGGFGVALTGGLTAALRRIRLERVRSAAVLIAGDAEVTFEDLRVIDTFDRADGTFGRAFEAHADANAVIRRAVFDGSMEVGVVALDRARLSLFETTIRDARARGCAETTCASAPGGIGLSAHGEARVSASGLTIDGADLCGAQVSGHAGLDLEDSTIRDVPTGACIQVEGYDLARVTDGVTYEDNEINVDTTEHAIPEPVEVPLASF